MTKISLPVWPLSLPLRPCAAAWCLPLCQSQKTKVHLQPPDFRIRADLLVMGCFLENKQGPYQLQRIYLTFQSGTQASRFLPLLVVARSQLQKAKAISTWVDPGWDLTHLHCAVCVCACIGCAGGVREKGVIDQRCTQAGFVFLIGGWILGCQSLAEI